MRLLLFVGLIFSFTIALAHGARVKIDLDPVDEMLRVSDVYLTQVQAKIQCQFKDPQTRKDVWRERYILTRLDRESDGLYRVRMGTLKLKTWMPEYRLVGCTYKLIALGEDFVGNALIGEFSLVNLDNSQQGSAAQVEAAMHKLVIGKIDDHEQGYLGNLQTQK